MTDSAVAEKAAPESDGRMSLMEHLVELRSRLIKMAIAVAIGAAIGWMLYFPLFEILRQPLVDLSKNPNVDENFLSTKPLELFMLRIQISTYLGIALAMPFLLWRKAPLTTPKNSPPTLKGTRKS